MYENEQEGHDALMWDAVEEDPAYQMMLVLLPVFLHAHCYAKAEQIKAQSGTPSYLQTPYRWRTLCNMLTCATNGGTHT